MSTEKGLVLTAGEGEDAQEILMPEIQLSVMEQRVADLLGDGHPQAVVAATLGISDGRVSQIYNQPHVKAFVSSLRLANIQAATIRDQKADNIEDLLLDKLTKMVDRVHDPMQATKMYSVINSAKRRGIQSDGASTTLVNQTVVNLTIPTPLIQKYRTNDDNQVTEVDGQSLVTMPSDQLKGVHDAREKQRELERQKRDEASERDRLAVAAKGHRLSEYDI